MIVKKPWTIKEIEAFKRVYPYNPNKDIADVCGRSVGAVKLMAVKLGVKKIKNVGVFKKGNTPWNKGNPYSPKGSEKGWFKKGHSVIEAGKVFVWNESGKQVKYIRTTDLKRVRLSKYIWELYNDPVPGGYILRHKDGDSLNCDIDNLELVSRAENLRLNNIEVNRSRAGRFAWMKRRLKV